MFILTQNVHASRILLINIIGLVMCKECTCTFALCFAIAAKHDNVFNAVPDQCVIQHSQAHTLSAAPILSLFMPVLSLNFPKEKENIFAVTSSAFPLLASGLVTPN